MPNKKKEERVLLKYVPNKKPWIIEDVEIKKHRKECTGAFKNHHEESWKLIEPEYRDKVCWKVRRTWKCGCVNTWTSHVHGDKYIKIRYPNKSCGNHKSACARAQYMAH